jgi:hypothetical protein
MVFGSWRMAFGNWRWYSVTGIRKLEVVFGNWSSETKNTSFGNWKGHSETR